MKARKLLSFVLSAALVGLLTQPALAARVAPVAVPPRPSPP